jgi:hypothetical protein
VRVIERKAKCRFASLCFVFGRVAKRWFEEKDRHNHSAVMELQIAFWAQ